MTVEMNVTYGQLNNAMSTNYAGLAVGCALFIPFTRKYGRRSTYILSFAVMAATSFWSARMESLVELYLTNLVQGLAGAINETVVEMTVSRSEMQ
jgi:MFS family permease